MSHANCRAEAAAHEHKTKFTGVRDLGLVLSLTSVALERLLVVAASTSVCLVRVEVAESVEGPEKPDQDWTNI